MKNSDSISVGPSVPSLFQIAAFFEDFFPSRFSQSAGTAKQLPIAEYMLNPERLMCLLRTEKSERPEEHRQERPASTAASSSAREQGQAKRGRNQAKKTAGPNPTPGSEPNKAGGPEGDGAPSQAPKEKKVEFTFKSSSASSVKLAGDFTEWEQHALEMMHADGGMWHTVVPLAPGSYSYRFIVDGQWCDDPSHEHVPNPFGTENAIIHVA